MPPILIYIVILNFGQGYKLMGYQWVKSENLILPRSEESLAVEEWRAPKKHSLGNQTEKNLEFFRSQLVISMLKNALQKNEISCKSVTPIIKADEHAQSLHLGHYVHLCRNIIFILKDSLKKIMASCLPICFYLVAFSMAPEDFERIVSII